MPSERAVAYILLMHSTNQRRGERERRYYYTTLILLFLSPRIGATLSKFRERKPPPKKNCDDNTMERSIGRPQASPPCPLTFFLDAGGRDLNAVINGLNVGAGCCGRRPFKVVEMDVRKMDVLAGVAAAAAQSNGDGGSGGASDVVEEDVADADFGGDGGFAGSVGAVGLVNDDWVVYVVHDDVVEGHVGGGEDARRAGPGLDSEAVVSVGEGAVADYEAPHVFLVSVLSQAPYAAVQER